MGMRWYLSDGFTCEIRSRIIDLFSYFSCPHFISPKVWRIWNINLILHFLNSKKYISHPQLHLFLKSDMTDSQWKLCRSLFFPWKAVKWMVHLINNSLLEPGKYSIIAANKHYLVQWFSILFLHLFIEWLPLCYSEKWAITLKTN